LETSGKSIGALEQELEQFPSVVVDEFRRARPLVEPQLAEDDLRAWAAEGVAIAQAGFRSWEATTDYFKVSAQALARLNFSQFLDWARWGRALSVESAGLSSAYFQASPAALTCLTFDQLEGWSKLAKSLYKGTWRSSYLVNQYFQVSPALFQYLNLDEMAQFTGFIDHLARNRHEFASDCLAWAEKVLTQLEKPDYPGFLALAMVFAETNWNNARAYFTSAPGILSRIQPSQRARFLLLAEKISRRASHQALPFLTDSSQALAELPASMHERLLALAEELLPVSCLATIEFLKSCPTVLKRVKFSELEHWFQEGMKTLARNEEGGIAYFRLELSRSVQLLEEVSASVQLAHVKELLEMYCRALTGKSTPILPAQRVRGIGWASLAKPLLEGAALFLPGLVERYPSKERNFTWYKVMVTHQAGHFEFGSYDFCFEKKASIFRDWRPQLVEQDDDGGALADLQRFFNLFGDRDLATDIFTIVEDSRIDYLVNHEYRGISQDYRKVQKDALSTRPPLESRPLRELFLEILIELSLGSSAEFPVPAWLQPKLSLANRILRRVQSPQATVEDCAEATIRLYQIISQIPNEPVGPDDCQSTDLSDAGDEFSPPAREPGQSATGLRESRPYSGPQEVEFRGNFEPELIQLLIKLKDRQHQQSEGASSPLPLDVLKELAEKKAQVEITELVTDEITSSQGLFVTDLPEQAGHSDTAHQATQRKPRDASEGSDRSLEKDSLSFLYDEWDFRASDYRPKWCRVRQKTMNEGTPHFFETTLKNHAALAGQVKRQFELISPQVYRKVKGLLDGEDFDLDAVIDSIVQRKAGQSPSEKVYWRRDKTERDVSVVFLLDMSASTIEYIGDKQRAFNDPQFFRDYKEYLDWLHAQRTSLEAARPFKRIIDLEKESVVLLIKALETIGDTYAIYGFSGYGRENVEFYIIKDLSEEFSDRVKSRIDSISPVHATRMGPAIRHATWKLEQQPSKSKFLFLISDGRPQDHGYGRDGLEKEYAINDTRMALLEAKRKNVVPFCLTVDRVGHDYLKTMCRDMGYEVVADIESLPQHLPALYSKLTV